MPAQRSVLSIGSFDGVHRGHAALIRRARELAVAGPPETRVVALVFDPHPLTVINPESAPARVTLFDDRRRWLLEAGADEVVRLQPAPELLSLSPEAFIDRKVSEFAPIAIVEGADFRFGRGRAGDVALLGELGLRKGFRAEVLEPVTVTLDDHSLVAASSTLCRWLLRHGRVRDAATVLGRPHRLIGVVAQGDRRGRTIGFPTANVISELLLPADGVYAARAVLPSGASVPAAVNIGERPTFAGAARTVEAHLLLDPADNPASPACGPLPGVPWAPVPGLSEYGWTIELELIGWLRDQVRFAGIGALVEQLRRDCARVRELVGPLTAGGAPQPPFESPLDGGPDATRRPRPAEMSA